MPIRLADIYKDTKTVTFTYDGQDVTVEYRHKKLTPVNRVALMAGSSFFMDRKPSAEDEEEAGATWQEVMAGNDRFYGLLTEMIVAWDVLGNDGKPLPVTVEWLGQLPQDFLSALLKTMFDDGRPDPTKGEPSPVT
jgi:hypothetical protein